MTLKKIPSTVVGPSGRLRYLSALEVDELTKLEFDHPIYSLFKQCALAVLNAGSNTDDIESLLKDYHDFDIHFVRQDRGIKLHLINAPAECFVDGKMIHGVRVLLFSVLRDVLYARDLFTDINAHTSTPVISDAIYSVLRNAGVLKGKGCEGLAVCWGGHAIQEDEYKYCKRVGYQLGLRGLGIITGCGAGVMKAPMKGATIGHAKQHMTCGRYIGITENSIIAAEPPNPIVNELVILPDIEKRLEAFVRLGHALIVFPGGPGTAEEIFYALALRLHPKNKGLTSPIILTGPIEKQDYFDAIDEFLVSTLGTSVREHYTIIIDDEEKVARTVKEITMSAIAQRVELNDSFHYNWGLHIPSELQHPFEATHGNMAALELHHGMPPFELALQLRRAFSGIVAGNIKAEGIKAIREHGPYKIHGDTDLMEALDSLLKRFVAEGRMKIHGDYTPCYTVVR